MNLNSEMFREIERQRWIYDNNKRGALRKLSVVIHPEFFYGVTMQIIPGLKPELFGMEITLSKDVKPNEFIIGEKFSVEVEK